MHLTYNQSLIFDLGMKKEFVSIEMNIRWQNTTEVFLPNLSLLISYYESLYIFLSKIQQKMFLSTKSIHCLKILFSFSFNSLFHSLGIIYGQHPVLSYKHFNGTSASFSFHSVYPIIKRMELLFWVIIVIIS